MSLENLDKKHIELIKLEEDIDNIIKKGGESAARTLYVINEFRQLSEEFNKFRYNMERQNSLLKSEEHGVKIKDANEIEKAALRIKDSFEEEIRFYQYLVKKEQEEKLELLKAFGEMEDITLLGIAIKLQAKVAESLPKARKNMYADYELFEYLDKQIKDKKIDQSLRAQIEKYKRQFEESESLLKDATRSSAEAESIIHQINEDMIAIRTVTDKIDLEKRKKAIKDAIKKAKDIAQENMKKVNTLLKKEINIRDLFEKLGIRPGQKKILETTEAVPNKPKKKLREQLEQLTKKIKKPK